MRVLITGSARGIGRACAELFLERGCDVYGMDIAPSSICNENYHHIIADVRKPGAFPDFLSDSPVEVLINNAGVQSSGDDIGVNLKGVINVTERYAIGNTALRSVVIIGSSSAHTGAEFPEYAASKGGLLAYTKNVAARVAPHATCNSIDPGGVITELNEPVMNDPALWEQIMALTPLKRWATPREIAEWVYFVGVTNRFMTGQNLLIDGGEANGIAGNFVWPE